MILKFHQETIVSDEPITLEKIHELYPTSRITVINNNITMEPKYCPSDLGITQLMYTAEICIWVNG